MPSELARGLGSSIREFGKGASGQYEVLEKAKEKGSGEADQQEVVAGGQQKGR